MEERVVFCAGEDGGAKPAEVHGAVHGKLLQLQLLGRNFGDASRIAIRFLLQFVSREGARGKSHRLRLFAADLAPGEERQVFGPMRANHPVPKGADIPGTGRDRGKPDAGILSHKDDIGADTQLRSPR